MNTTIEQVRQNHKHLQETNGRIPVIVLTHQEKHIKPYYGCQFWTIEQICASAFEGKHQLNTDGSISKFIDFV